MKKVRLGKKMLGLSMITLALTAIIVTIVVLTTSVSAAATVSYVISNDWGGGAIGNVTINNTGSSSINGWTVTWTYTNGQTISALWGGDYTQSGSNVTVTNPSWGSTIQAGSSYSFGFIVNYSGSNPAPTNLTVNGQTTTITVNPTTAQSTPNTTPTNTPVSTTAVSTPTQTSSTGTPMWSSSDQWATLNVDGYTIYNNIWGSGAGTQTVWANSYSNWGVFANHPNTGGIKSYPNCEKQLNKPLSQVNGCSTTFNSIVPSSGSYTTAYDIWCGNYAHEIMLWMNWKGEVGPIAGSYDANGAVADYTNVNVGGHTWNVYKGSNGSNAVYSFLKTSQTNSGTIDVKAICNWIQARGWFGDVELDTVQLGWEITSASGGLDFEMRNYSVTYN